ncbi:MAG: hypothetical protein K2O32_12815 [Acetatifactor sp.]|nr:hypothetical protein [Acetatifactor sp.]
MDAGGLQCRGCGSGNVVFDPKRRILTCHQCGKEEYYSRATLNANRKVLFSKENALSFFNSGKFDNAQHYALEILNIVKDNAPALYIIAYHDEFVMRKEGAMRRFFENVNEIPFEYDEVRDLKQLLVSSAYNMLDFEFDIIQLMAANMQSQEDADELGEFIDKVCPFFISKRTSMDFFTEEHAEMYKDLAEHCGVPKTCFSLIKAISDNPDSPYANNSFYLGAKTKYFYEHFVLPVGTIVNSMKDNELKAKFVGAYEKKKQQYEQDANLK